MFYIFFIEGIHMSYEKLSEEEIKEVFRKLNINIGFEEEDTNFEVWQVPPIKKGSGIYSKVY